MTGPDQRHEVYLDVIEAAPDGITHTYWSTHCRHGQANNDPESCKRCDAAELAPGVPRSPGRCKHCGSPCICPHHKGEVPSAPTHVYRHRSATVRAIQWTGNNEAEVVALVGPDSFEAVEDCPDDPDATAAVRSAKHGGTWQVMYDFDWVVECSGGWTRTAADEFEVGS